MINHYVLKKTRLWTKRFSKYYYTCLVYLSQAVMCLINRCCILNYRLFKLQLIDMLSFIIYKLEGFIKNFKNVK